ncbi:MurR/RpiR family transcriptional regulator [Marinomonas epiphytica]
MQKGFVSLTERIRQQYAQFTQVNQRLADYLQQHPDKVLILSTNEIAEACGVSKTSVSRFIRKLGYEDHQALRNELMAARDQGNPILVNPIETSEFQQELGSLEQLWHFLEQHDLSPLIDKLAHSRRIKVIGYRNSYPLALHFRQQLMQCRAQVELLPVPGQSIGEDLVNLNDEDFVVVIGIRRRVNHFAKIMSHLKKERCLLITDQSGQKLSHYAEHFILCQMNNVRPLDSYAAPMSLLGYLANQVYLTLGEQAQKRSGGISDVYTKLNEIE